MNRIEDLVQRVLPEKIEDKPAPFNVGRNPRRQWRAGEPVHIVKPVRYWRKQKQKEVFSGT